MTGVPRAIVENAPHFVSFVPSGPLPASAFDLAPRWLIVANRGQLWPMLVERPGSSHLADLGRCWPIVADRGECWSMLTRAVPTRHESTHLRVNLCRAPVHRKSL
jgi:hypothetical protein